MLRGAVIIFTGLLSVAFLGRRLALSQWLGILVTILGLVVVGLADLLNSNDEKHQLSEVITGDLLIIMAQVIVAIQMVLEEKFVYKHDVHPLRAVGTEASIHPPEAAMEGPDPGEGSSFWGSQDRPKPPREPLLARRPPGIETPQEEEEEKEKEEQHQQTFSLRSLLPWWPRSDSPGEHPNDQEASGSRSSSTLDGVTIHEHPGALESILKAQETQFRIFAQLFHENEQLKCNQKDSALQPRQQTHTQEEVEIFRPPAENQRLQQEHWETKKNHKPGSQKSSHQKWSFPWSNTGFLVQVLTTGKTGGCEKQFLDGVSKRLLNHRINLQVDSYQANSGRFLLVFCPVASRIGTDIGNALEGLSSSVSKALLVVLHHKPKDNHHLFVDTKLQGQHQALVRTVHARYTVQDGLYACRMNEEAMADVAKVIKDLSKEG
ncbi:hypothetical protein JD844_025883 [Phrynosoma platyrhinos]|uniref:Solute carrier family 35 member F6 n=1 Tax=Phrynosoma platyrhinos TaxID=52577 RepID=A0ABQ7T033_PHRPL|nr:hypothetical protein JD844_025883 [Phrynosoma platyrhinos]